MFKKFVEVSKIMCENWENEKLFFENTVIKDNITLQGVKLNAMFGIILMIVLSMVKPEYLLIYFIIWIFLLLTGIFIDKKCNIFINYIYISILCYFLSFTLFYLNYLSDLNTTNNVSYRIYSTITIILLLFTPYFSYKFAVNGWMNRLNLKESKKIKNNNRLMLIASIIPGGLGIAIERYMRNELSNEINEIVLLILFSYLIIILVFAGFIFTYKGIMYYINEKNMRSNYIPKH
jgi:hypothetical protein